jgi:hypothetical protein
MDERRHGSAVDVKGVIRLPEPSTSIDFEEPLPQEFPRSVMIYYPFCQIVHRYSTVSSKYYERKDFVVAQDSSAARRLSTRGPAEAT